MQTTTRIHATILEKTKELSQEIAHLEKQLFELSIDREIADNKVKLWEAELELEIAEDLSLRNEGMRKAQKTITSSTNKDYLALVADQQQIDRQIAKLNIELDRRKRMFAIAKLEAKLEIAKIHEN